MIIKVTIDFSLYNQKTARLFLYFRKFIMLLINEIINIRLKMIILFYCAIA
ncbi:MAG: hypothetical protein JXB88_14615 [Spirochaetales bacterium]|nr:hypothetical protein [Spirochaetales bacterium]